MSDNDLTPVQSDFSPSYWTLPISRCPDELLSMIFLMCQEQTGRFLARAGRCLSHVCRVWRRVALDTPGLWDMIKFSSSSTSSHLELIEAQITRSRGAPFDVWLYSPPYGRLPKTILHNIHRSRQLLITSSGSLRHRTTLDPTLQPYLLQEARFLEQLDIGVEELSINFTSAPKLARVALRGAFDWSNATFIGTPVRYLKLFSPKSLDWVQITANLPLLEELHVHGDVWSRACEDGTQNLGLAYAKARPKHLKKLVLGDLDPLDVATLIELFPSDFLNISATSSEWTPEAWQAILSGILPSTAHDSLYMQSYCHRQYLVLADAYTKPRLILSWCATDTVMRALFVLEGAEQLGLLRKLTLDVYQPLRVPYVTEWQQLFLALPALQKLTLTGFETSVIGALFEALDANPEVLPHLEELAVDVKGFGGVDTELTEVALMFWPLLNWIKQRSELGRHLRRLVQCRGTIFADRLKEELGMFGCTVLDTGTR